MVFIPEDFTNLVAELPAVTKHVEGFLYEREIKLLALLAACPTADLLFWPAGPVMLVDRRYPLWYRGTNIVWSASDVLWG